MAKKKKKSSARKSAGARKSLGSLPADLIDFTELPAIARSVFEDVMGTAAPRGNAKERKANALVEQAYNAAPGQRIRFLQRALEADPDCVDAHLMLGMESESLDKALQHLRRAVDAGKQKLGDEWEKLQGHFWGYVETRPYMRAKCELAMCLWAARQYDEAIQHYEEMLRLNPGDNQGVRELLLSAYLERGNDANATKLIEQYEDESAVWEYARLLLAFRAADDSPMARKLLSKARKVNKFVPKYLLGDRMVPSERPQYVGVGDESEAIECAVRLLPAWRNTPGITSWLRGELAKKPRAQKKADFFSEAAHGELLEAPPLEEVPAEQGEVWQVDAREMSNWVQEGSNKFRPWLTVVHSKSNRLILASAVSREFPADEMARDLVERAIVAPLMGDPVRPEVLEISRADWQGTMRLWGEPLGVRVAVRDDLKEIDELMEGLSEFTDDQESLLKPLVDIPGLHVDQLAGFFEAASAYYRHKPWQFIPGDTAIRVDAPSISKRPWYASVMGQSGIEQGLALYDKWEELSALLSGSGDEDRNAKQFSAFSLMFGESLQLHPRDLVALEKHNWEVAGPEAYPCFLRVKKGMKLVSPTLAELTVMEACLKAIPAFVRDQAQAEHSVTVGGKQIVMRLSVVDE